MITTAPLKWCMSTCYIYWSCMHASLFRSVLFQTCTHLRWAVATGEGAPLTLSPEIHSTGINNQRAVTTRATGTLEHKHLSLSWLHWELHSHDRVPMPLFTHSSHQSQVGSPWTGSIHEVVTLDLPFLPTGNLNLKYIIIIVIVGFGLSYCNSIEVKYS